MSARNPDRQSTPGGGGCEWGDREISRDEWNHMIIIVTKRALAARIASRHLMVEVDPKSDGTGRHRTLNDARSALVHSHID